MEQGPRGCGAIARACAIAAMACLFAIVPAAQGAQGALAGAGSASTLTCATGPLTLEGVNPASSTWVFHITAENHSTLDCADATSTVIAGTWDPASGGVIATGTGTLMLGAVPTRLVPTATSISICFVSTPVCYSGSVTVTRA